MTKHTPGEWCYSWSPNYFPEGADVIRNKPDSGTVIAVLTNTPHKKANGALIAESPAMAALLRDLLPMVEDWADGSDDTDPEGLSPERVFARRIATILDRIDGKS